MMGDDGKVGFGVTESWETPKMFYFIYFSEVSNQGILACYNLFITYSVHSIDG